jgi:hypothetical protein
MKELKDEHMVYLEDLMYLPIQYHRIQVKQPYFKGKGQHSVKELEDICEQFTEYCHQQSVIKQNAMKRVVENKFDIKMK